MKAIVCGAGQVGTVITQYLSDEKFEVVDYDEVINRQLKVMDTAAVALARENNIPVVVFAQNAPDALMKAVCGEGSFTIIKREVQ